MKRLLAILALTLGLSACVVVPPGGQLPADAANLPVIVLPPTQVIMGWPPQYINVWPYYWGQSRGGPYSCPWPYSCYRGRPGVPPPVHYPPGWHP